MMSKCGSCGRFMWEISLEEPSGSNYKVYFVRCTSCKVPIGVMDYLHIPAQNERIEKSILALGNSVKATLQVIDTNVRRLFDKR